MPAEHCFVYRASSLGDVVLTTGVLGHWHRTRGLRFSVATREPFAPLLEGHPAMREVVALGDDDLRGLRWADTAARLARGHSGETLVDLHGTIRSRVLGLFWKGPVRRHPKASLERRMLLRGRATGSGLLELTVPQRYALALDETPPPAR
jgi:ADP-heptose:LPS heptosyltransferase